MAVFRHAGLNGLNPRFHHKDDSSGHLHVLAIYLTELAGHVVQSASWLLRALVK